MGGSNVIAAGPCPVGTLLQVLPDVEQLTPCRRTVEAVAFSSAPTSDVRRQQQVRQVSSLWRGSTARRSLAQHDRSAPEARAVPRPCPGHREHHRLDRERHRQLGARPRRDSRRSCDGTPGSQGHRYHARSGSRRACWKMRVSSAWTNAEPRNSAFATKATSPASSTHASTRRPGRSPARAAPARQPEMKDENRPDRKYSPRPVIPTICSSLLISAELLDDRQVQRVLTSSRKNLPGHDGGSGDGQGGGMLVVGRRRMLGLGGRIARLFGQRGACDERGPVPDLDDINHAGADSVILFDSNRAMIRRVQRACRAFAAELSKRGERFGSARRPPSPASMAQTTIAPIMRRGVARVG